jgi:hypothetical protein
MTTQLYTRNYTSLTDAITSSTHSTLQTMYNDRNGHGIEIDYCMWVARFWQNHIIQKA